MRRYYLLKGYALVLGVGLFVLGLVGLVPSPLSPSLPENMLHLSTGSLFVGSGLVVDTPNQLRGFVGGMGGLLVLGKAVIVVARWPEQGLQVPQVGFICLLAGVGSLLIAVFVGDRSRVS